MCSNREYCVNCSSLSTGVYVICTSQNFGGYDSDICPSLSAGKYQTGKVSHAFAIGLALFPARSIVINKQGLEAKIQEHN